jgi:hypothetical protein
MGCRRPSAQEHKRFAWGHRLNFQRIVGKNGTVSDPGLLDADGAGEARTETVDEYATN